MLNDLPKPINAPLPPPLITPSWHQIHTFELNFPLKISFLPCASKVVLLRRINPNSYKSPNHGQNATFTLIFLAFFVFLTRGRSDSCHSVFPPIILACLQPSNGVTTNSLLGFFLIFPWIRIYALYDNGDELQRPLSKPIYTYPKPWKTSKQSWSSGELWEAEGVNTKSAGCYVHLADLVNFCFFLSFLWFWLI